MYGVTGGSRAQRRHYADPFLVLTQRNLFKAGSKKRPSGATDYPLSVQESGDPSYLFSPNIVSV